MDRITVSFSAYWLPSLRRFTNEHSERRQARTKGFEPLTASIRWWEIAAVGLIIGNGGSVPTTDSVYRADRPVTGQQKFRVMGAAGFSAGAKDAQA